MAKDSPVPLKPLLPPSRNPRIRILTLTTKVTNKVQALNDAVLEAKADWIALLDVDDRWAPNKLAEQVAITQHITPQPIVIGTHARYFGEFQGSPVLPTGWISPIQLCEANPVINSSAMLRKEWAHWSYHPDCPRFMEDYYLWMRVALGPKDGGVYDRNIYVHPQCLVDHRIHKASAFNGKDPSTKGTTNMVQKFPDEFFLTLRFLTLL